MFKFELVLAIVLLSPILVHSMEEYECLQICGGKHGGRCKLDRYSSSDYGCVCDNGFDGKNCQICAPGYFGKNCAFQCPLGLWGNNCTNECNCSMPGSISPNTCFPANGNCICKTGYLRRKLDGNGTAQPIWNGTAQDCIFPCEPGQWGLECQNRCDCQNDVNCHHVNGKCLCPPDEWTGAKCEKPCVKGTAKPGCKFPCDCIPGQGSCDELTGLCSCYSGFMGPRCEWPCPNGFWGPGCQERCPNCRWCNPINGTCEIIPSSIADRFAQLPKKENVASETAAGSSIGESDNKQYEM